MATVSHKEYARAAAAAQARAERATQDGLRVLQSVRGRSMTVQEWDAYMDAEDRRRGAEAMYEEIVGQAGTRRAPARPAPARRTSRSRPRRTRWQLWLGVALFAALVAALAWIAVRPERAGAAPAAPGSAAPPPACASVVWTGERNGVGLWPGGCDDGDGYAFLPTVSGDGPPALGPVTITTSAPGRDGGRYYYITDGAGTRYLVERYWKRTWK